MFGMGTQELIIILVVVLVLFGGRKIPELMRGLGQGVREFNAAKANIKTEIEEGMKEKPVQVPSTPTATNTSSATVENK
jgi:sec-independent protein translocase protein TatA